MMLVEREQLSPASRPYEPQGGALELWHAEGDPVAIVGPAGTGKTRAALERIYAYATEYPGSRHLAVRKTRASMTESVLVTWESKVVPQGDPMLSGAARGQRQSYEFANGSVLVIGGLDNPDRIMSTEYDTITVFEATEITQDDFEKLETRLRNGRMPHQQIVLDLNPGAPSHWIKGQIDGGKIRQIVSRHSDNPTLTKAYLRSLSRLTGPRRARLYEGKWAGADGLVYDGFDRGVHVRVSHRPWKLVITSCDDGFTNPFAAGAFGIDGDLRMHMLCEHYQSGMLPDAKLKAVRRMAPDAECVLVDPSAADIIAVFRVGGLPAKPGQNDVLSGINRVAQRLAIAEDGQPRLTFDPSCVNTIREFESYEWMPDKPKDTPKKENDHCPDLTRYAVMHVDRMGGSAFDAHVRSVADQAKAEAAKKYAPGLLEQFREKRKNPDWGFAN